ncbi:MAG TPA: hypothetical protein PLY79_10445 [Ferruginibacter sp.]|nr:hypothetical protein [Ferruginibacter sp.]
MAKVYLNRKVSSLNVIWENFRKVMDWINNQSGGGSEPVLYDISDTSTIVGWSSYTTKKIMYIKNHKTVTLIFFISGTSNSSQANITLPSMTGHTELPEQWEEIRAENNTGTFSVGYSKLEADSNILRFYRTFSETNWTSSGQKSCIGTVVLLINE